MASNNRFEKQTDELRQVVRQVEPPDILTAFTADTYHVVVAVQRKWLVEDGPAENAMRSPPPEDRPWAPIPGQPLMWVPVKVEWRDLACVSEDEVAASTQNSSTTT